MLAFNNLAILEQSYIPLLYL